MAVLTKTADAFAELSQTLYNLRAGQKYSLVYLTCDREAAKNRLYEQRTLNVDFSLSQANILRNTVFTDRQSDKRKALSGKRLCINQRFVIFEPASSEIELKFSNPKAASGDETVLNFIAVRPYFPVEENK